MSKLDVIRAWKDEEYRLSLDETERALLPENPAGLVELSDADLDQAAGGHTYSKDSYSDSFSYGGSHSGSFSRGDSHSGSFSHSGSHSGSDSFSYGGSHTTSW